MKFLRTAKHLALFVFVQCFFCTVNAQDFNLDTSLNDYYPVPNLNKPGYLQTAIDPTFNTKITRITGDVGTAVPNVDGENWRNIARHGYSARQPWNADESVIYLGKHKSSGGGWGASLFLDGETYQVIKKANNIPSANEQRWHPTNPDLMMLLRDDGIYTWSYSTGTTTKLFSLTGYSNTSTGNTGNYSNNGSKAGIYARRNSDGKTVAFAIDMANNIKHADIDMTGVDIDYVSISPLGNYVLVNAVFNGQNDSTKIFDLNGNQVGPHWAEYGRPSHYDMAVGADGIEYVVGNSKSSPDEGRIIKRRLTDGAVTVLSQGGYGSHASARSLRRVGWIFTSMSDSRNWGPYYNELVAVRMDGSGRVERIASIRSNFETYDNETQACPSPSGGRVLYATDWGSGTYPIQCYIADFRDKIQGGDGAVVNAGLDQNICQDDDVTLTATGAVSYAWSTGATTASITVTPNTTTTYTVTGTQANGDTSTDSVVVTVNAPPVANAGEDTTICEEEEVTLTASGGSTYLWSNGATTQSITVSPSSSTSYSVIATQNSCSSTDEVLVTVNPRQTINAGNDVDINLGESTTLTVIGVGNILWSTGETTASITVSPTVNTTYTVDVTEQNGCTSTDEVRVTIIGSVDANAGADASICEGEDTVLTASGGDDYLWNTGETTISITVNPTTTTNYSVIVSNATTSDTDEVTVFVNVVPTVNAGDDKTINLGEFVTLNATGADTYLWSNGATQPNIAVSPQNTTTYYVTGYTNNCSDEAEVIVNVANAVSANAGKDTIICIGDTHTLIASGGESYEWSTGETTQSINVSPFEDTIYTVSVSNQYASGTDDVWVTVEDCGGEEENSNYQYSVYPNPASGGILNIQLSGLTNASSIYIHDTIGKLIYIETIDASNGQLIQKDINISNYTSGLYFVTLEEDNRTTTKKIIFQ